MADNRKQKQKQKRSTEFFACRVPRKLMRAFQAHARKHKASASALVVGYMATATGVEP